jgi:peptidoglycan/LPS O-acetylase OafA/YrhL
MTLSDRMTAPRHGFDWLRLLFASGVLIWHSACLASLTKSPILDQQWAIGLASLCVPGFFAASGFLVAASADRNDIRTFYAYRLARVAPGLAVVVLLTAVVLGPLTTSLPVRDYLSRPVFWLYWLNALGINAPALPGVFEGRFFTAVNGSLWTIGLELACYFWLGVAVLGGLFRRRRLIGWSAAALIVSLPLLAIWDHSLSLSARPVLMLPCFALGSAIYVWRDRIPYSLPWGLAAAILAATLSITNHADFSMVPWTYAVVVLGLSDAPKMRADLSYGLYLAAFPIQQVIATFPVGQIWWGNLALAAPLAVAYAALSWFLIERPALSNKRRFAALLTTPSGRLVHAVELEG